MMPADSSPLNNNFLFFTNDRAIKVNVQGSLTMGASEMLWPLEQGFHEAV